MRVLRACAVGGLVFAYLETRWQALFQWWCSLEPVHAASATAEEVVATDRQHRQPLRGACTSPSRQMGPLRHLDGLREQ